MTPQETLHSILLDAKARIKDGELYDDDGDKCVGLCGFIAWHPKVSNIFTYENVETLLINLFVQYDPQYCENKYYGKRGDFTDPKRLALLDWLIERTAP